jgi:uncharacterized membrane protein
MTITELKKDAKIKLTGNYLKSVFIYLIYFVIVFAFSALGSFIENEVLKLIYEIVVIIFTLSFEFGLIASIMKIVRNENVSTTDFINIGLQNIGKIWSVFGRTILKLILPIILIALSTVLIFYSSYISVVNSSNVLFIVSAILFVAIIIYTIIKAISYTLSLYILNDYKELTGKEIVEKSEKLMKGNIMKYIGLGFSFIGWFILIYIVATIANYLTASSLLVSLISGLGSILLSPYITAATIVFYEDLIEENQTESEAVSEE